MYRFYLAKHSGRQLSLQPSLGSADLNAVFFAGRREEASGDVEESGAGASASNGVTGSKGVKKHIIQVSTGV